MSIVMNMILNSLKLVLLLGVFSASLLLPDVTHAQLNPIDADTQINTSDRGFIPCSGVTCSACDLVSLANTISDWLIGFLATVFAVVIVVAGIRLATSGGNESAKSAAKSMLTNALIGFLIVLGAWLLIDTVLRALVGDSGQVSGRPWGQIECWDQVTSQVVNFDEDETNPAYAVTGGTSVTPVASGQMVSLRSRGLNVANWHGIDGPGRTDLVHPNVATAILQVQNAAKINGQFGFQVTAAYTDGVGHSSNSQHYRGTAVDIQPINGQTKDRLAQLCRQAGFSFVLPEARHVHCDMR